MSLARNGLRQTSCRKTRKKVFGERGQRAIFVTYLDTSHLEAKQGGLRSPARDCLAASGTLVGDLMF
jgi:hypothetical protein